MFRTLTAGEIECRVAQVGKAKERVWCSILIYKDARVDQKLLDEVIGPMNWKDSYEFINGSLYCTVSIWDNDKKEWVSKQNVGTESNTEKEKGQASDAFKRAAFNWGIGRELYTAPKIFIDLKDGEYRERDGKIQCTASFFVREISYNADREIDRLAIVDSKGVVRYTFGNMNTLPSAPKDTKPVYVGKKGEKLTEGDSMWMKFARRVKNGEVTADGTPIAVMMAEYFSIPNDAMKRFLELVSSM